MPTTHRYLVRMYQHSKDIFHKSSGRERQNLYSEDRLLVGKLVSSLVQGKVWISLENEWDERMWRIEHGEDDEGKALESFLFVDDGGGVGWAQLHFRKRDGVKRLGSSPDMDVAAVSRWSRSPSVSRDHS